MRRCQWIENLPDIRVALFRHFSSMPLNTAVKHGARYRLTWLVMACVLPMLALIAFILIDQYRHNRDQLIQKSILTARAMALTVDKDTDSVKSGLYALASSPYLGSNNLQAFHRQASKILQKLNADNIYLADENGQQILHTNRPFGTSLPATRTLPFIKRVFETGNGTVSDLFTGSIVKKPVVAVIVPVWQGNRVVYALGATFYPERLLALLANQGLPADWVVAIYDGSGHFIARSHGIDSLLGKKGSPAILEQMAIRQEGTLESRTVDGTPVIGVFSKSKVSNWAIGIGIPKAQLTADLWKRVGLIATITFFILLSTLMLAWALGGKIARSIHALIAPALALGRNEKVQVETLYLREADEVGNAIERAADILAHTRHKAYHDPLTGLANRALFGEMAEQHLALCRRYGEHLAILYLDLDGFKSVNDTYGHAMGDRLLQQVAARLESEVRRSDLVARLGGDEFAAVLMNTDRAGAANVAAKLVEALSVPYSLDGISVTRVSPSIGVAIYPETGRDIEVLLQRADYAMYLAKSAGKRQYAIAECGNSPSTSGTDAEAAEFSGQLASADKSSY
jgi:diguanylate cyclase (GGDEF)-like protein